MWENGFGFLGIVCSWILYPTLHEDRTIAQNKIYNENSLKNYWTFVLKQNNFNILKELSGIAIIAEYLKNMFVVIAFNINPFVILKWGSNILFYFFFYKKIVVVM